MGLTGQQEKILIGATEKGATIADKHAPGHVALILGPSCFPLTPATTQVRSCTVALMFFAACSPLFLCRTSSFLCVLSVLSSYCLPVSFCAACSLVPVLRPHPRSIRASVPLADRSSRDVPPFSPCLPRVSVLVSTFRAPDPVVSLLTYSVLRLSCDHTPASF
jgi:hypothetical protein